jgi:hypothetical protein
MTRSRGLRQRIVRIRVTEYRIAQLQLAEARRSASQISSIAGRIDALAFENRVTAGEAKGASDQREDACETGRRKPPARKVQARKLGTCAKACGR